MGCVSSKQRKRPPSQKGQSEKRPSRINSSRRIDDLSQTRAGIDRSDSRGTKVRSIGSEKFSSCRFSDNQIEKKPEIHGAGETNQAVPKDLMKVSSIIVQQGSETVPEIPEAGDSDQTVPKDSSKATSLAVPSGFVNVTKDAEPKQVAGGWPTWLVSVAGEALVGWVPRRASTFEKLEKIGQGTYSSVYRARDLLHNKIVALKKVRFDLNDLESVKFMAREIIILRKLDHPNVIKLEGLITAPSSSSLYLVFEYMEHDLVGLASLPGVKFSEPQVKCYMQQLLSGLDHCHSRGVLHRDIKGSNLLIDSNGILKIADFGLATFFNPENNIPLTTRVVTLWYRPPELLLGAVHYGIGVDLWSTGCIFGELYAGKPILPGKTEVEQLHKIFKLCGSPKEDYWRKLKLPPSTAFKPALPYGRRITEMYKDFPATVLSLLDTLLSIDPDRRGSAATALESEYFKTEPFACDPSSLPKYPPSKEIDAKIRDEARKQRPTREKNERQDSQTRRSKETKAAPPVKAIPSLTTTIQKHYPEPKSRNDIFNSFKEAKASRYPDYSDKQRQDAKDMTVNGGNTEGRVFYSGPLMNNRNFGRSMYVKEHALASTRPDGGNEGGQERPIVNQQRGDRKPYYRSDSMEKQIKSQNEYDTNDYKMYMSGPLLAQPNKVDQMLEEHDRQLQEFARLSRKTLHGKTGL
ncbi:PREDICTED: probable serine/threonine-protein kinase At1g54610 [Tarenaya hassleriana]|uniref:probable serine/threonine-protein kinase At1g54610 n=1 Tax=Tarenaya hassleriana TaxID=28532 RepID=UPI00053C0B4F|nr:PREDICTED: probable serine/threonine-protein kinase At1g54610 [Tarenaya hassleriana]